MPRIGVIAGSGLYEIEGVAVRDIKKVSTPYGEPSDVYRLCEMSCIEFVFLPRHGTPHHIPPHMINYRANMWGFRDLGVERILSINAAGVINRGVKPGDIVIPDQVIDMTHGRRSTFYDGDEVVHIDFTMPYCPELRNAIINAGREAGLQLVESGTYICVNGPRLESRAEIEFFAHIGADIVGMTGMPEACLARELELCFASVTVATNYAAGISDSRLTTSEVVESMKAATKRIKSLLKEALRAIPEKRACGCKDALKEARM